MVVDMEEEEVVVVMEEDIREEVAAVVAMEEEVAEDIQEEEVVVVMEVVTVEEEVVAVAMRVVVAVVVTWKATAKGAEATVIQVTSRSLNRSSSSISNMRAVPLKEQLHHLPSHPLLISRNNRKWCCTAAVLALSWLKQRCLPEKVPPHHHPLFMLLLLVSTSPVVMATLPGTQLDR